jgi:hypothetical protein
LKQNRSAKWPLLHRPASTLSICVAATAPRPFACDARFVLLLAIVALMPSDHFFIFFPSLGFEGW